MSETRDSSTHGWLTMSHEEYDRMRHHDYAGEGNPPLDPSKPGYWAFW